MHELLDHVSPASHQEQMVAVDHRGEELLQLEVAVLADLPLCQCQGLQACPRRAGLALGAVKPQQEMRMA